jgi:hypothetical protein
MRNYEVHVRADSVDAKWDNSDRPLWFRVLGCAALIGAEALVVYYWLIRPDRNGYSTWWRLVHEPLVFAFLRETAIPAVLGLAVWSFLALYGIRSLLPCGEKLHCDHSELSVAKIPWFSLWGQWSSRTFPVSEVSRAELADWPADRRNIVYLIRFWVCGFEEKALRGIQASEGYRVLKGLKAMGVGVRLDPDTRWLVQQDIRDRRAEF